MIFLPNLKRFGPNLMAIFTVCEERVKNLNFGPTTRCNWKLSTCKQMSQILS